MYQPSPHNLVHTVRYQPARLHKEWKQDKQSIFKKLTDLYLSEAASSSRNKHLFAGSNLLSKLVQREQLQCVVLNLYPGNKGYSLMIPALQGPETQTLPYEEDRLLEYIDNEELPPILVEVLDRCSVNVFYNGCIILEVRDHRRILNGLPGFDKTHVLLRPTMQTLLMDVERIAASAEGSHVWTVEDKQALEASLYLATAEPLCLEPNLNATIACNWIQHRKSYLNRPSIKRLAKRHSQVAINRKERFLRDLATPKELSVLSFLEKRSDWSLKVTPVTSATSSSTTISRMRFHSGGGHHRFGTAAPPTELKPIPLSAIDVSKCATVLERPNIVPHDNTPIVVQEYVMETERPGGTGAGGKVTHVCILKRPTDDMYFGRLYVDRDGVRQGVSCTFLLGGPANVQRYLRQFREIFTEEGRKAVKITHIVPGRPPVVQHTHGFFHQQQQQQLQQQQQQQQLAAAQNIVGQQQQQQASSIISSPVSGGGSTYMAPHGVVHAQMTSQNTMTSVPLSANQILQLNALQQQGTNKTAYITSVVAASTANNNSDLVRKESPPPPPQALQSIIAALKADTEDAPSVSSTSFDSTGAFQSSQTPDLTPSHISGVLSDFAPTSGMISGSTSGLLTSAAGASTPASAGRFPVSASSSSGTGTSTGNTLNLSGLGQLNIVSLTAVPISLAMLPPVAQQAASSGNVILSPMDGSAGSTPPQSVNPVASPMQLSVPLASLNVANTNQNQPSLATMLGQQLNMLRESPGNPESDS